MKTTSEDKKLDTIRRQEEREAWYKLVVKVISWSEGLSSNGTITINNKISSKEWANYVKGCLRISKDGNLDKVKEKIKATKALIEKYNGFF